MLHSKSKLSRAAQASSAVLLVTFLAACGGGGGDSGGGGATPPAGGGGNPPAATPPTLGGLNCVAATGGGTGYVLGVCSVVTGTTEAISAQFQNFPITVATDASVAKRFTLNVQSPLSPGAKTVDATTENCAGNQLGSKVGFLAEVFDDATKPATSPRFTVLSFTQSYGENTALCRTPSNNLKAALYPMTYTDVGVWERYLGEAALYYGGWYALRGTTNAVPTAGKTYASGVAFGYRFTPTLGYGMSADVVAGASWNGSAMSVQINNFAYSRASVTNPNPGDALPTLTLSGTYDATTKKVSGTVSGTGVSGIWEGEFAGPAGQEFAAKFQLVQSATGHRVTGSFAVK